MIYISKVNETYLKVDAEISILEQIKDYFTYPVKGAKYSPAYKSGRWDGNVFHFNISRKELYLGLYDSLVEFLEKNNLKFNTEYSFQKNKLDNNEVVKFIKDLNLPYTPRDYQVYGFLQALINKRAILLSATSSGKSLMQYMVAKYLNSIGKKVLIIVPKVSLVEQMYSDFEEYGCSVNQEIHRIYAGKSSFTRKNIVITTYQSLKNIESKTLDSIGAILVDEAHGSSNETLKKFLCSMTHCEYKLGFTGTLDGDLANEKLIEGLLGKQIKVITSKELIERGYSPKLLIQSLILKHEPKSFNNYQEEIEYICNSDLRNEYIKTLCSSLEGNTLLLFNFIENHGKVIYEKLKDLNRETYFVYGGTDIEVREEIRKLAESKDNIIICASYGVFSTGVNIKKLHNIVFASSTKSKVLGLQSIGRGLRSHDSKDKVVVYDLVDDFSGNSSNLKNYTLGHFYERVKFYKSEGFKISLKKIKLN